MLGAREKEPLAVPRQGREGFPEQVVFELEREDGKSLQTRREHLCRQGGKSPGSCSQREA